MSVHWREHVLCPVHYPVRGECTADCLPQRLEFPKTAQALRVYWHHRRTGVQPMSLGEYRMRFEPRG